MSYFSEVALIFNKEEHAKFRKLIKRLETFPQKTYVELLGELRELLDHYAKVKVDEESQDVIYYLKEVRWYIDFDVVRWINKALTHLEYNGYLFMRVGESVDDCEYDGAYFDNHFGAYIARYIDVDLGLEREEYDPLHLTVKEEVAYNDEWFAKKDNNTENLNKHIRRYREKTFKGDKKNEIDWDKTLEEHEQILNDWDETLAILKELQDGEDKKE